MSKFAILARSECLLQPVSMLLSHCPNCQHDNPPGERFCAACGVPLDLKPCPVCGKVDNLKATVCTGCGAHFPALTSLLGGETNADAPVSRPPIPPLVSPPPTTMRALPLIVVALAAGGIPLLWLYRNTMPVPKVWQAQTPGIEAAAPQVPQIAPPTTTVSGQISLPANAAPQPSIVATPTQEPAVAVPMAPPVVEKPAAPVKPASKPAIKTPLAPPATKPAAPVAPAAAECTEALAAVGLCTPKGEP